MGIICYCSKTDGYIFCSCPLLSTAITKADRVSLPALGGSLRDKNKASPTPGETLALWMTLNVCLLYSRLHPCFEEYKGLEEGGGDGKRDAYEKKP